MGASSRTQRTDPMIGRTLNDTYRLDRRIGSGGMGRVYAGLHLRLSKPVAVKVLHSRFASNPEAVERFRHEARSASALGHPNIVQVFDFNQSEDAHWYIVMEVLEGMDLRGLLKQSGRLEPVACLPILRQVCDALDLAHSKGLIHRDLKPSNIFLQEMAGRREVKLLDFGIAKVLGADLGLTVDGALLGTPHYMAPEQAGGGVPLTRRVDIYAVGTVLFEMMTGRRPFEAETPLSVLHLRATQNPPRPSSLVPTIPPAVDDVVVRALARDPNERFESTAELALAFERAVGGPDIELPSADAPTEIGSPMATKGDTVAAQEDSDSEPGSSIVKLQETDELRMATVVVVTASASSPEDADLDEVLEQTEGMLEDLAGEFEGRGAVIEQKLGDSLTAVFGVPVATGDDPVRAVQAGLAARELGKTAVSGGVEVRVGAHTGRVLARRGKTGVTGEVVKIAAKLADECPPGEVLIGHETYAQIRGRFDVSFRDHVTVRGSREPLRTYRVTGERRHGVILELRGQAGREAPFVGRDAELSFVHALYRRMVDEGLAQVVLVVGGPGMGKTRLAYELASLLEEESERTSYFPARAGELAAESPFGLLREIFRTKLGALGDLEPNAAGAQLLELIKWPFVDQSTREVRRKNEALDPSAVASIIGGVIGMPVGQDAALAEGPRALKDRLALALRTYLSALAQRQPVVLVLDDLHRADAESLELFESVLSGLEEERILLLGLVRPDLLARRADLFGSFEQATHVHLRSISSMAATALVRALLGGPPPVRIGPAVHKRAGGNPHIIEEIVHTLRDSGRLKQDPETKAWTFLGDLDELEVPGRAEALLQSRLDQLPSPDRDLLRIAAVIGPVFWESALVAMGGESVQARLESLSRTGLIHMRPFSRFPGTRQWAFKSELMCNVARGNLPSRDRRQIHLAVADWLGRQGVRDPDTLSLRALHLAQGGERDAALAAYREAAEITEREQRFQAALACRERAFRLAESGRDEDSCLSLAPEIGRLAVSAHAPSQAIPVLERALEIAERRNDAAVRAHLLQLKGRLLAITGELALAKDAVEMARSVAASLDDVRLRFEVHKTVGFVLYYADEFAEASVAFEQCIEMARQLGDKTEVAKNLHNVADASLNAGQWERAREFADLAVAACHENKMTWLEWSSRGMGAYVRGLHEGDRDANRVLEEWMAYADESVIVDQQVEARKLLATVLSHQGRRAEALDVARAAYEMAKQADSVQSARHLAALIAELEKGPTQTSVA